MKVSIETKFNIGDAVYAAEHYYDLFANPKPYTIKNILINITGQITHISYEVEQDNLMDHMPEEWTFSTYEECVKWCKKYNQRRD